MTVPADAQKYAVTVFIQPTLNICHASLLLSSLIELHREGAAEVRITFDASLASRDSLNLNLLCQDQRTGITRLTCCDFRDRADYLVADDLKRCDLYFKRNFDSRFLTHLPSDLRGKVKPFNLNYACRTWRSTTYLLRTIMRVALVQRYFPDVEAVKAYLTTPGPNSFECPPSGVKTGYVLFQTRLWEPSECYPDDAEEINLERVALVKALRKEFGRVFVGGLVPTSFARQRFPDLLTPHSYRRHEYLRLVKHALVGVYTRGLHWSYAFKLGEYMAASLCIVATGFRNELAQPLAPGQHYLQFAAIDEAVLQCGRAITDPSLCRSLACNAWEYYENNLKGSRLALKLIETASGGGWPSTSV
ncbi:MAG: hypothetical protein MN733_11525 [Nitrososphaera sp.]|nr:hypothetical protein [Nitrososphaera sp.]